MEENTAFNGNNINKNYGDDPSHDVFQINFPYQFPKRIAPSVDKYQPPARIFEAPSNLTANKSRPIDNDSKWKLSAEDAKRYINTSFVNLKDHNSGKCSGKTAFQFFRNKIDENQLLKIYDLCKINTDAALTPRKFGVLLHIIVLTAIKKPSLPMPKKLPEILEKILHNTQECVEDLQNLDFLHLTGVNCTVYDSTRAKQDQVYHTAGRKSRNL